MPLSPLRLLLFVTAVAFLVGFVQLGILRIAFDKLGLSPESASLLLLCTLFGSLVNLPLFSLKADSAVPPAMPPELPRGPFFMPKPVAGKVMVAVNVGGAVVPVAFSLYLSTHNPLGPLQIAAAVVVVAAVAALAASAAITTSAGAVSSSVRHACMSDYFACCSSHAVGSASLRRQALVKLLR